MTLFVIALVILYVAINLWLNGKIVQQARRLERATDGQVTIVRVVRRWNPVIGPMFDIRGPENYLTDGHEGKDMRSWHFNCTISWIRAYVTGFNAGEREGLAILSNAYYKGFR